MAKALKPDRTNRQECLEYLWRRLDLSSRIAYGPKSTLDALSQEIEERNAVFAAYSAVRLSNHAMDEFLVQRWESGRTSDDVRKAFAYLYWGEEILFANIRASNYRVIGDDFLNELLTWQGIAAACGESWFVDWVTPYLNSLFAKGIVDQSNLEFHVDKPARLFTQLLQRTLLERRWPHPDETSELGAYGPLISKASTASDFAFVLVDYCDYRTAECFGYHGIDATKRRKASVTESVLDRGNIEQVFPVELLTLAYAFHQATGRRLELDAPHPILQSPLMAAPWPELMPFFEDEITQELQVLGATELREHWAIRQPISI